MSNERGFSLVEVLAALVLIAGGLLAIATMSITSLHSVDGSGEETASIILAQQRMEWLRNQDYASAALAAGTTTETLTGDYEGYARTTVITNDVPLADVKRIRVTVDSPGGRSVTIASFLAG